jgi:hypothetical protein
MNTNNWDVSGYQLQRGDDRVTVQIDPALGDTIRVGNFDAFRRLFGGDVETAGTVENTNGSTNGNGGAATVVRSRTARSSGGKKRGAKRSSGGAAAAPRPAGRTSEWVFTDDQREAMQTAVSKKDDKLSDMERRVLQTRFLSKGSPSTVEVAKDLGLKHNSEVTLLTRSALRHLGIRVPRLRKRSK